MPKTLDKLKIKKVKNGIINGKSAAQAMKDAGYAKTTAEHKVSPWNKLLKVVQEQVEKEFKLEGVTPTQVLKEIDTVRALAQKCGDLSTAGRMSELKGRYLAMFTDKVKMDQTIITKEDQAIIDNYMPKTSTGNRLGNN